VKHLLMRCLISVLVISATEPLTLADDDRAASDWFEKRIRPVLVAHCYECHSATSKQVGSKLKLDSRSGLLIGSESGPAIVPGKPQQSLIIAAMRYEGVAMPPDGRLPETVVADFEHWIRSGAFDPRTIDPRTIAPRTIDPQLNVATAESDETLWSLAPLTEQQLPESSQQTEAQQTEAQRNWVESPIDQFIAARHAEHGLSPVADASPGDLLRRLYYDLIGLPPTADQIDAFEQDHSAQRYSEIVDRLLSSPQFGERWGRYWLDLARFAESNGSDRNVVFPHAWRYRDYVIRSFNNDKPFDEFVREQIAGDLMPSDDWRLRDDRIVATGFLAIGPKLLGEGAKELFEMNLIDEQIDVMSRSILGLTISCARCHDHKFDPVSTRDYYGLAGIFGSTATLYGPMTPGNQFGFDRPLQPLGENGAALDKPVQKFRNEVAEAITVRNKARSDRYRVVRQKAALEEKKKKQTEAGETEATDALIAKLNAEIAEWDEKVKQLEDAVKGLEANPPEFPDYCMAVREGDDVQDCAIRIRGEATRKGDVVPRGVPALINNTQSVLPEVVATGSGRLQLANWLTSDSNPLTPRVAVNRIWQRLLGEGLVRSVDNFGVNGERPSHPELLDWLAIQFRRDCWSTRSAIRRIVHSRTYRLASVASPTNHEIDPANVFLWRAQTRRLDVESLRDSMLFVSGELDLTAPGPSVISTITEPEFNDRIFPSDEQLDSRHRTVYLPVVRYRLPEMLREFDFADPNLVIGERENRTMPSQSLFLMNSEFVTGRAKRLASQITAATTSSTERVRFAFRLILSRPPNGDEVARTLAFAEQLTSEPVEAQEATSESTAPPPVEESLIWTTICHALLSTAEFRFVN
jgi:hypothetical protein